MARLGDAAAFVKTNVPLGQENALTSKDAVDVVAYFTRQPVQTSPGNPGTGRRAVAQRCSLLRLRDGSRATEGESWLSHRPSSAAKSSGDSLIRAACAFSSRCSIERVPGIGSIAGERARSHASAT